MARWLERFIRLFGVFGVIACSVLFARAVNNILDARYLGDTSEPVLPDPPATPTPPRPASSARDKRGRELVARNMFCSTCAPDRTGPPEPTPGDPVPETSLPLELLATNLSRSVGSSFATVRNRATGQQGSFFSGDSLPGAGHIEHIGGASVVFHNPETNRIERLSLMRETAVAATDHKRVEPVSSARSSSPYAQHVRKIDDNNYEVEREVVQKLLSNPTALGARVRPVPGESGDVGFRLYGVRRNSPLSAIGLENGDTIEAINGFAMTTNPDKLLEMYTRLSEQQDLSVRVNRRGKSVAMNYRVR